MILSVMDSLSKGRWSELVVTQYPGRSEPTRVYFTVIKNVHLNYTERD